MIVRSTDKSFLLDTNVFIESYRRFYGFDFCPGFWKSLVDQATKDRLASIDVVRAELERGGDELFEWIQDSGREIKFFETKDDLRVLEVYRQLQDWVSRMDYREPARNEFRMTSNADGWLVAYAKAYSCTVVTLEGEDARNRRKVLIPALCRDHGVECVTLWDMLRACGIRLVQDRSV